VITDLKIKNKLISWSIIV